MADEGLPVPTPAVPNKPFPTFKSLSFDIFGTLIDWEPCVLEHLATLPPRTAVDSPYHHANTDAAARTKLAALYKGNETGLQRASPGMKYDQLLTEAYLRTASDLGITVDDQIRQEAKAFGASIGDWVAFPDTVDAMKRLAKYYKLVPLSNVDRESFARTCAGPLNGVDFWRIYTAQQIGSYKPDLRNFEYLLKHLDEDDKAEGGTGIRKEQNLHVAQSMFHDHKSTKKMEMASVWIIRRGQGLGFAGDIKKVHDDGEVGYGWKFNTLGDFADEVERQWANKG